MKQTKEETLKPYPEWHMTMPGFSPRSRLHHLEPIGIDTPWVESLTSYVARLAKSHHVTPKQLVLFEILPALGKQSDSKTRQTFDTFWSRRAFGLNGNGLAAQEWVQALQTLTQWNTLSNLTMITWKDVLSTKRLLRTSKAWCPYCYEEWRQANKILYGPLLWALSGVDICLKHQQPLVSVCPNCMQTQPFLTQEFFPGYCSNCQGWLGRTFPQMASQPTEQDQEEHTYQMWVAETMGQLLAAVPNVASLPPSQMQIVAMLTHYRQQYTAGSWQILSSLTGIQPHNLHHCISPGRAPCLDMFLRMCYALAISPLEFLTATNTSENSTSQSKEDHSPKSRRNRQPLTETEIQPLRQVLVKELFEITTFPVSIRQLAKHLGYSPNTILKYCPEQYHELVRRRHNRFQSKKGPSPIQLLLEEALQTENPRSLASIARSVGCRSATLQLHFPELCQALLVRYAQRLDRTRIQQFLETSVAREDQAPSLSEVARQIGIKRQTLKSLFPDLCDQIAAKYRTWKHKQHEERVARICAAVRQAAIMLHQQGIYPGGVKVARVIGDSAILATKEALFEWQATLKELGYREHVTVGSA